MLKPVTLIALLSTAIMVLTCSTKPKTAEEILLDSVKLFINKELLPNLKDPSSYQDVSTLIIDNGA